MVNSVLAIHLLMALYMIGLIWFVQIVHYPLMAVVGADAFVNYEQQHTYRTSFVTAPMMLVELGTAVWLLWQIPHDRTFWSANLLLIALIWASTFFVQVPLHQQLSQKFDERLVQKLVQTNWIRTVLWTGKGIGLLVVLYYRWR